MEPLRFEQAEQWEAWLAENYREPEGAWVLIGKKGTRKASISLAEAADVAMCYGWIDSIRKSVDGDFFMQKYSPRRPRGTWSRVNVERAEALMAAGRMRPPGLAEVNAAKADGRWEAAYEPQRNATVPPDLEAALKVNRAAGDAFSRLGKTDRYLAMLPLLKATTPATRAARIKRIIEDLTVRKGP
jgi:uncharacterized protein YdeI (YjbR/CyaY-like superfamily)